LLKEEIDFGHFIKSARKRRKIRQCDLARGLFTVPMMSYVEQGSRPTDYLMRLRLMSRLGIGAEDYEIFLQASEYKRYIALKELMVMVENRDSGAESLFCHVIESNNGFGKIEQQILLDMRARIYSQHGASDEVVAKIYERALAMTVPDYDYKELNNLILAPEEIFLLLCYMKYVPRDRFWCEQMHMIILRILEYPMDSIEKAKILPMAVVLYGTWMVECKNEMVVDDDVLIDFLNESLRVLKESGRLYYILEVLELQNKIYSYDEYRYERQLRENKHFLEACKFLYDQYPVSVKMEDDCYIYRGAEIRCIGDVIVNRRKMLGLSRKDTYTNICSAKTFGRIERKTIDTQQDIINQLFERLHITPGYVRPRLLTNNANVLILADRYMRARNNRDYYQSNEKLSELRSVLDYRYVQNRQAVIRMVNLERLRTKEITNSIYERNLWRSLSYSGIHRWNAFSIDGYLTKVERDTLYNLATKMDYIREYEKYMQRFIPNLIRKEDSVCFELDMTWWISRMGDRGEYALSSRIGERLVESMLRYRRGAHVMTNAFNLLWNSAMQEEDIFNEEYGIVLTNLYYFSELMGSASNAVFMKERLSLFNAGCDWTGY
jgi:transcriptional regulator with XRE-family HTH domain